MYCITKWTKEITDSGKDEYTGRGKKMMNKLKESNYTGDIYRFRLLDDDGIVYAYGISTDDSSFAPLDRYMYDYGCTEIQYRNQETGEYETL